MRHTRNWSRGLGCLLALLAAAAPFSAAQQPAKPPAPAAARTPRTLVLAPVLLGNAPATLAVLDAAGRLLAGVAVELSGRPSVTTDATGRASFVAPPGPGVLVAWTAGRAVSATSQIEIPGPAAPGQAPAAAVDIASYPHLVSLHDRLVITGSGFRGAADANHVLLADQPCLVLAASPMSLVVLPGVHVPIGGAALRLSVSGDDNAASAEVTKPVAIVLLEVNGPAQNVRVGAQGLLTVQARGTAERVQVELRNASPGVVALVGGNVLRVVTSGGDQNVAEVPVKFLASGNYTIIARLLSDVPAPASGT